MLVSTAITRKPPIKVDFPFDKIYNIVSWRFFSRIKAEMLPSTSAEEKTMC